MAKHRWNHKDRCIHLMIDRREYFFLNQKKKKKMQTHHNSGTIMFCFILRFEGQLLEFYHLQFKMRMFKQVSTARCDRWNSSKWWQRVSNRSHHMVTCSNISLYSVPSLNRCAPSVFPYDPTITGNYFFSFPANARPLEITWKLTFIFAVTQKWKYTQHSINSGMIDFVFGFFG